MPNTSLVNSYPSETPSMAPATSSGIGVFPTALLSSASLFFSLQIPLTSAYTRTRPPPLFSFSSSFSPQPPHRSITARGDRC